MNSFGSVMKEIRKDRKMTQKMLSQDICSQSVLSRIENDEELPNVMVMQQLCQRLGVSMDQVLTFNSERVQKINELMETFAFYFRHKEYHALYRSLDHVEDILYLESDLQRYYYYRGSCQYYLFRDNEQALQDLRHALDLSYHRNKPFITDWEIQIMSCMGKVFMSLGNQEKARRFLEESIHQFYTLPSERIHVELAKIFYNYASFLIQNHEPLRALEQVDQGISWLRQKNSYYFLPELFRLKSKLMNDPEESRKYEKFAEYLEWIHTVN